MPRRGLESEGDAPDPAQRLTVQMQAAERGIELLLESVDLLEDRLKAASFAAEPSSPDITAAIATAAKVRARAEMLARRIASVHRHALKATAVRVAPEANHSDGLGKMTGQLSALEAAVGRVLDLTSRPNRTPKALQMLTAKIDELSGALTEFERVGAGVDRLEHRLLKHFAAVERRRRPKLERTRLGVREFEAIATPILRSGRTLLEYDRLHVLWEAVANTADLKLPIVEVGAYRGGSAAFLARANQALAGVPDQLHVYDTFAGHPASSVTEHDSKKHPPALFADVEAEDVVAYLAEEASVTVHVGDFTQVGAEDVPPKVSLVHLDVDLYLPTLAALDRFASLLPAGGTIVLDDFGAATCPGIRMAVEEHLASDSRYQVWTMGTEQLVLVRRLATRGKKAAN